MCLFASTSPSLDLYACAIEVAASFFLSIMDLYDLNDL